MTSPQQSRQQLEKNKDSVSFADDHFQLDIPQIQILSTLTSYDLNEYLFFNSRSLQDFISKKSNFLFLAVLHFLFVMDLQLFLDLNSQWALGNEDGKFKRSNVNRVKQCTIQSTNLKNRTGWSVISCQARESQFSSVLHPQPNSTFGLKMREHEETTWFCILEFQLIQPSQMKS